MFLTSFKLIKVKFAWVYCIRIYKIKMQLTAASLLLVQYTHFPTSVSSVLLQTIFYNFPLLSGVIDQELIPVSDFLAASPFWERQSILPLCCRNVGLLDMCKEIATQGATDENADLGGMETSGNVQKKLTPWSGPEGLVELFPDLDVFAGKEDAPDGLIVVASLVNKAANLGGVLGQAECMPVCVCTYSIFFFMS